MARCGQCDGAATSLGTCIECARDVADCTCPKVEASAVIPADVESGSLRASVPLPADDYGDVPHPADDTGEVARRNGDKASKRPAASRAPDNGQETHRSHLRMAERMAERHGGRLRYAHGLGWLVWDGARWSPDTDGEPFRCAIEVVKQARRAADGQDATLADDAKSAETSSGLRGIVEIARYLRPLAIAADQLDTDPYLLNCANGTLDLRTGDLREHDPADLITRVTGCGYDPEAAGPTFERFLAEILPVADVRDFVQRLFGYALLGKVTEHLLPIFIGTGCNGKTTLLELVLKTFGDYGIMADPELLTEHPHGQHPTGQADLLGVRLAVMQETDAGRRLAIATVKRLTGGDKIRARKMRQDFFEFDPSHTAVMVTNHKPRIPGDDPAAWRRIRVVPFDRVIQNPDSELPERLALELPAVLRWAVGGYLTYAAAGLADPDIVTERTKAFRVSSDVLGRFLAEGTVQKERVKIRARELFEAWRKWCENNGEAAGSEVEFSDSMAARGYDKRKSHGVMIYEGLGLVSDSEPSPDWTERQADDQDLRKRGEGWGRFSASPTRARTRARTRAWGHTGNLPQPSPPSPPGPSDPRPDATERSGSERDNHSPMGHSSRRRQTQAPSKPNRRHMARTMRRDIPRGGHAAGNTTPLL